MTITVLVMVRLLLPLELVIGIFFVVVVVEVLLSFSLFYLVQYILVLCMRFYYLRSAMLVIIRPVNGNIADRMRPIQ